MPHRVLGAWYRGLPPALTHSLLLLGLLVLSAVCLAPAVGTGYWAEDIYYSAMVPALPILRHSSWLAETWISIQHSFAIGRFYPITPIITAVAFRLFPEVMVYKTYIVAVTLLDLALGHTLIRQMTGRPGFAALTLLCTLSLIQFRLTVDPMLGYYGQIQWVIASFLLCLLGLHRFLTRAGSGWLGLSVLAYLACTLAYEMTYPLVLIPLWMIGRSQPSWRRGLRLATPYILTAGFAAAMTLLVRWLHPSDNYVHKTDWHLALTLGAIAHQVSAGLPLSYFVADPLHLFPHDRGWVRWVAHPGAALVGGIALPLTYKNLRTSQRPHDDRTSVDETTLVGMGLLLATLPAVLTGVSPYHRNYLSFGVGWIGVMMQYHGIGLLGALGIGRFLQPRLDGEFSRRKCLLAASGLAGVLWMTYRGNVEVALAANAPVGSSRYRQFAAEHGTAWHWHRENLIGALDAGVMDQVPDGSRVQLVHRYPLWHDTTYGQFFYTKQTARRIESDPSDLPTTLPPDAPCFRVWDALRNRRVGMVTVLPVTNAPTYPQTSSRQDATGRIFVRHPSIQPNANGLSGLVLVGESTSGSDPTGRPTPLMVGLGTDLATVNIGAGWGLFLFDPSHHLLNSETLRVIDNPVEVAGWLRAKKQQELASVPRERTTRR